MANDVKFEGKDRRIEKIEQFLAQNDLGSLEACRELCLSKGVDVDAIVKGVQPIAACYESIVPRIGGNIDRRAFVSCHLGKNKWVRVSFFIKSGGADKVLPFIHGNGKIVGSIKNLAEILIVFHKTRLRR